MAKVLRNTETVQPGKTCAFGFVNSLCTVAAVTCFAVGVCVQEILSVIVSGDSLNGSDRAARMPGMTTGTASASVPYSVWPATLTPIPGVSDRNLFPGDTNDASADPARRNCAA